MWLKSPSASTMRVLPVSRFTCEIPVALPAGILSVRVAAPKRTSNRRVAPLDKCTSLIRTESSPRVCASAMRALSASVNGSLAPLGATWANLRTAVADADDCIPAQVRVTGTSPRARQGGAGRRDQEMAEAGVQDVSLLARTQREGQSAGGRATSGSTPPSSLCACVAVRRARCVARGHAARARARP